MSTEHYMVCHQCKDSIWVAQDGLSGFTFYSGEKDCMRAWRDFLLAHQRHPLELVPDHTHEDLEEKGYAERRWRP